MTTAARSGTPEAASAIHGSAPPDGLRMCGSIGDKTTQPSSLEGESFLARSPSFRSHQSKRIETLRLTSLVTGLSGTPDGAEDP